MSSTKLLIFARTPRLGQVKTRLQPLLGAEGCLALHKCLIDHAMELAHRWSFGAVELWLADEEDGVELDLAELDIPEFVSLRYQEGKNLGERMQYALESAVSAGDAAVLIGTDCPQQLSQHLVESANLLETGLDLVVQPATDGGFVLIACAGRVPNLSGMIDWGTERVLAQLERELQNQDFQYNKIETVSDLDTEEDYYKLQIDMRSISSKLYKLIESQKKVLIR